MIGEIIEFFMRATVDGAVGSAEQRRLAAIARAEGKARGVLRVVDGEAHGLARGWRGFEVRPLEGAITFEFNRLVVDKVGRRTEPLSGRESLRIPEGTFEVIELRTPTGTVEWALMPEDVAWVIDRVGRPEPGTPAGR